MRSGIFWKNERIALSILFLSLLSSALSAQDVLNSIVSLIEENADGLPESVVESVVDEIDYYSSHPLRINGSSRNELERFVLFNVFQIESILDYRAAFGNILSRGELAKIDGFNEEIAETLSPYLDFSSDYAIGDTSYEKSFDTEFIAKGKKKWADSGIGLSSKLIMNYGRHSAGLILDSDAGEPLSNHFLPDFTSAYYQYEGRRITFAAGNYTARFGQGLVLWKAFPVSFAGTPSSMAKKSFGIKGYNSLDEDNYLRGAAATINIGRGQLSFLASFKPIDANVKDGKYTSIVTGGIHSSASELVKRHSMNEYLAGVNYNMLLSNIRIGVTAAVYGYDKSNGRRVAEYNKYQMYDGVWGNVGLDLYGFGRHIRYFAEMAVDAHLAPAALAGIIWSPEYEFEMSVLARHYDKSYIATHAAPYSAQTSISNQDGLSSGLKWLVNDALTMNASCDFTRFPWKRYGKDYGTNTVKARASIDYKKDNHYAISSRITVSLQSDSKPAFTFKNSANYSISSNWDIEACAVVRQRGYAGYCGMTYSCRNGKIQASARLTGYDVKGWESRISLYEKGMPQTYSLETFYGAGWSGYAMLKYAPNSKYRFYLKISDRYSAFFIRIFIPG